jgi:6-pyruvoyltetrahydropterin/6-carboxytetrahydropterin synthase
MHVTVKGIPDPVTGFVTDLSKLSEVIQKKIVNHVDHKNINLDVPFLKGIMASTENLAIAFWKELEKPVAQLGAKLYCIKLQETENNYVEYYGE